MFIKKSKQSITHSFVVIMVVSLQLTSTIDSLMNTDCKKLSFEWYPIRETLTEVERDYLRERELSSQLESKPSYIVVGAAGGIAVVALAISIFWGLNGSTFARE